MRLSSSHAKVTLTQSRPEQYSVVPGDHLSSDRSLHGTLSRRSTSIYGGCQECVDTDGPSHPRTILASRDSCVMTAARLL